ncbi:MAG: hypothetical protein KKB48_09670 [Gammaproteobacteria bacterium]|nr:hypothetical protein [Sideroxydans sp.]MBU3904510.1 hypothetical protein [Gammaproteobacteria bacterium]
MKKYYFVLIALLLASCTSHSPIKEGPTTRNIMQFSGARNDLFPEHLQNHPKIAFAVALVNGGVHTTAFPLTYAVQCNTARTSCKHAVVKTELKYITRVTSESAVSVSGVLHSEIGRSFSVKSGLSSTYSQTQSMSIPPELEVIAELKDDRRFDRVLELGEKLELKGLGGVQVVLEFK